MCLSGLDYFSTLGYQPAIAALAAGLLSPVATFVLVLVTLGAALPMYRRVARESPHGQGSIAMLERLLPHWRGKLLVLVLLGFAVTDFMITITLSAADASAHLIENPFAPQALEGHQLGVTLVLILGLVLVFLRGFREVMGLAVVLVAGFLTVNAAVILTGLWRIATQPAVVGNWWESLSAAHGDPVMAVALALIVFPKLALGLSGFETGVVVMPQIRGGVHDTRERPAGRIRGTQRLLTTAAVTMSGFLFSSSLVTTLLIPHERFLPGGEANGRALAYLAHEFFGDLWGTVYGVLTIGILWFAGASAIAGLLNLIPRCLPRYGMAPEWVRAPRPLVLIIAVAAVLITVVFDASVDAQGGAYATGVLVLMTMAALAVTLSARRRGERGGAVFMGMVTAVFVNTTAANVIERPDGLRVGLAFIGVIVVLSFLSRFLRTGTVRSIEVELDPTAVAWLAEAAGKGQVQLIAHETRLSRTESASRYRQKLHHMRLAANIPHPSRALFLEVRVADYSDFITHTTVRGVERRGFRVLSVDGTSVPRTIAAVLLAIRGQTGVMPHIYFRWTTRSPLRNLIRLLLFGQGEVAPVTRELPRAAEPDHTRRPWVHVG